MATSTVAVKPRTDLKRPATAHTEDVVRSSTSSQVEHPEGTESPPPELWRTPDESVMMRTEEVI
eukprot:3775872-Amphidinium_carterae.1